MDTLWLLLSKAFKSKTLIVNYVSLAAATLALWLDSPVVTENPALVATLGGALAAVNVVLRLVTNLPLSEK